MEAASDSLYTQRLDHLGLVAGMCQELGIAELVDQQLPTSAPDKIVSCGQAVVAMILNGLGFVNSALYLTPHFYEQKCVSVLLGVPYLKAHHLNDDTLGRTLDTIYRYGVTELFAQVSTQAVERLGLAGGIGHLDSTTFSLEGSYDRVREPGTIEITHGYSKDHRPDLKQVALNLICEHRSGIPVLMSPGSGNQNDHTAFASIIDRHIDRLHADVKLQAVIADSALYSYDQLQAMDQKGLQWITRVPHTLSDVQELLEQDWQLTRIDDNDAYTEIESSYAEVNQRWIVVRSEQAYQRQLKGLDKSLLKTTKGWVRELKALERQSFHCREDAEKAMQPYENQGLCIGQVVEKHHYGRKGKPRAEDTPIKTTWHVVLLPTCPIDLRNQRAKRLGYFILATNVLDVNALPATRVLELYRGQHRVERGFRFLKDPQFLADSLFLKKPERIEALLMIMTLCLLVYAALEYRIRKGLKETGQTFPNQNKRPITNPTTRWIFYCFMGIDLVYISDQPPQIAQLKPQHLQILHLLGPDYLKFYR